MQASVINNQALG